MLNRPFNIKYTLILGCLLLLAFKQLYSQTTLVLDSSEKGFRKIVAGPEYEAGKWKQFLWGKDYREEWATPVRMPVLDLDSAYGGLSPIKMGGGRQTKSLHMVNPEGKRYVLRTVNKRYTLALPEIARGTILEKIANDQIATNHPYAANTVPIMAEAAGIYHTNPKLFLVPPSPRLGEFNGVFANSLCLLEERPDETNVSVGSFGLPKDIDGSDKMIENITDDNDFTMDQEFYLKTRLFDMFIGDWGRHVDNWRWAQFDSGKIEIYRPVPKDRDQTQAKFEGFLFKVVKSLAGMKQLQTFDHEIKDITRFNFPALEIDRRFTNELTRQVWIDSARALQKYLTDEIIDKAVRQMPPQIFAISGEETIAKLKSRRNNLHIYASEYYDFLTKDVDIPGSNKNEYFEVRRLNDLETQVNIHKITKEGEIIQEPLFSRTFLNSETEEIRLYGLKGKDVFFIKGDVNESIMIRIIGGKGKDSLVDQSHVSGGTNRTKFYDNEGSRIVASPETKIRLGDTVYIYPFNEKYKYDVSGFGVVPGLNRYYRVFLGISYKKRNYGWREKPFESEFKMGMNYSFMENSFHPYIEYTRPQLFGAWNLNFTGGYDGKRRFNYFGLGNETTYLSLDDRYHWFRTENFYSRFGIDQTFQKYHNIQLDLFYDGVKVEQHPDRYVSKPAALIDPSSFDWKHFGGGELTYRFLRVNDRILPTKGFNFIAAVNYTMNLNDKNRDFTNVSSGLAIYLPLSGVFSFYMKTGAEKLSGEAEFYQYNYMGGNDKLRGYIRYRFRGETVAYNQKELRWVNNVKTSLFNGKAGLVALFDHGRVWHPDKNSDKWHHGAGGGFILIPFNKIFTMVTYTISPEDKVFNVRLGKFF